MEITCYTTTLALSHALIEIAKDKGEDYSTACFDVVNCTNYYLIDANSKHTYHTCDLPVFADLFRKTAPALHSIEHYASMIPKSDLESYVEKLIDYAARITEEPWVLKWKEDVIKHFQTLAHLVTYAHEKLSGRFHKSQLEPPSRIIISHPMPMSAVYGLYDEINDALIFFTSGLKTRQKLYRKIRKKYGFHLDNRFAWPGKYPWMAYWITHEVAHRCVHLSLPPDVDSYLHENHLDEPLCKILALDTLVKRASSDRKLRMEKTWLSAIHSIA